MVVMIVLYSSIIGKMYRNSTAMKMRTIQSKSFISYKFTKKTDYLIYFR